MGRSLRRQIHLRHREDLERPIQSAETDQANRAANKDGAVLVIDHGT